MSLVERTVGVRQPWLTAGWVNSEAAAEPCPPGLVLGYASLPEAKIAQGIQKVGLAATHA